MYEIDPIEEAGLIVAALVADLFNKRDIPSNEFDRLARNVCSFLYGKHFDPPHILCPKNVRLVWALAKKLPLYFRYEVDTRRPPHTWQPTYDAACRHWRAARCMK